MRLLGDVITEGPDGPLLGPSTVVNIYIYYIYLLLVYVGMWVRYWLGLEVGEWNFNCYKYIYVG